MHRCVSIAPQSRSPRSALSEPLRLTFVLGGALTLVGVWVGALGAHPVPTATSLVIDAGPILILAPVVTDDGLMGWGGPEGSSRI